VQLASSGLRFQNRGEAGGFEVDARSLATHGFEKVLLYLLDWNLADEDGKTVPIVGQPSAKRDALGALDLSVFTEIRRVIDAHVTAQEKKRQTSALEPAAIS
jgi:hypothetical protein